jgi:hypothetical protein
MRRRREGDRGGVGGVEERERGPAPFSVHTRFIIQK